MSSENIQFEAFFSCKDDEKGRLQKFQVCGNNEEADRWVAEQLSPKPDDSPAEKDKKDQQKTKIETVDTFENIIDKLMQSLMSFYDLISINTSVRKVFPNIYIENEFEKFRTDLHLISDRDNVKVYGISEDKISSINSKLKRLSHIKEGISSIPANVIMGLVSRFDANISQLVRFLLEKRKEWLATGDRVISVKDVLAASSFDDLISDLIDEEIYDLMRGSHSDQIKYIEDNFSIKIKDGFDRWPNFVEIFERRNLAAHGEGFANARYDRLCSRVGVDEKDRLALGEEVSFPDSYLRQSTDLLLEFGILLIWWLWLKHESEDTANAYNKINSATYDMICERRYRLAANILTSCMSRKTVGAPESVRRMMAINLANCCKKLDDEKGFQRSLQMFDWTASADEYKISVAALNGDIETVCAMMSRVTDDAVVGKAGLRDWPVFDSVRDDDRFAERFKEVFGEHLQRPKTQVRSPIEGGKRPLKQEPAPPAHIEEPVIE